MLGWGTTVRLGRAGVVASGGKGAETRHGVAGHAGQDTGREAGATETRYGVGTCVAALMMLSASAALGQERWPLAAPGALRVGPVGVFTAGADPWSGGTVLAPGDDLAAAPRWTRSVDEAGRAIAFVPHAPLGVTASLVLALGETARTPSGVDLRLFAMSRDTGAIAWSVVLPARALESQSGVTLDLARDHAVVATGRVVSAVALGSGAVNWQTTLPRSVVNACVVVADERDGRARAFVTDYSGFSAGAGLACINLDGFDAAVNPRVPGEIVWRAPIGASSGNTPAYLPRGLGGAGLVYVASAGQFGNVPGRVWAFDASATAAPAPAFSTVNATAEGFYGGVAVRPPPRAGEPPLLGAASYAFFGGLDSANLLVVDGVTGAVRSSSASNRTQATPIMSLPGVAILSSGIGGFGSAPSLLRFDGIGSSSGALVWDSATATWVDHDQDGLIGEGEFEALSGWVHQPVLSVFEGRARLLVGTVRGESLSAGAEGLRVVDVSRSPGEPEFWLGGARAEAGGSAAVAGSNVYSVGPAGLSAFGPGPSLLDRTGDGRVGVDDLHAWEAGSAADLNADGVTDSGDAAAMRRGARWSEAGAMIGGRR